jgi:hypothetical protein
MRYITIKCDLCKEVIVNYETSYGDPEMKVPTLFGAEVCNSCYGEIQGHAGFRDLLKSLEKEGP